MARQQACGSRAHDERLGGGGGAATWAARVLCCGRSKGRSPPLPIWAVPGPGRPGHGRRQTHAGTPPPTAAAVGGAYGCAAGAAVGGVLGLASGLMWDGATKLRTAVFPPRQQEQEGQQGSAGGD